MLGPVGGGQILARRAAQIADEIHPFYVLKAGRRIEPVFESPLSLFDPEHLGPMIERNTGIPRRRISGLMSPWCYKRLEAFWRRYSQSASPRSAVQAAPIAIAKTEPGDENNQDIPRWSGQVDIRKLETFAQNDPDASPIPVA